MSEQAAILAAETGPVFEFSDWSEMRSNPAPLPPMLVHGLLHQGCKMMIAADSKAHKTFALMDLARAVATGSEWLGMRTTKGKVLYVNLEIQQEFFADRITKIDENSAVGEGMITALNLRGKNVGFEQIVDPLINRIRDKGYVMIILDPIYKLLGDRDENSNGDVASLLNELERVAVATGAAIVFAHHFAKGFSGVKRAMDRASGAGVFSRDGDVLATLTEHKEDGAYVFETKLRHLPSLAPFVVRFRYPFYERDGTLRPEHLKTQTGAPTKYSVADIRALWESDDEEIIKARVKERWVGKGNADGSFEKYWKAAVADHEIYQDVEDKRGPWKRFQRYVFGQQGVNSAISAISAKRN